MRLSAGLVVFVASAAFAQDRAFPSTWGSGTLTPSTNEVQVWLTTRLQRVEGTPWAHDELKAGLTHGLGPRLDTQVTFEADIVEQGIDSRSIDARLSSSWRYRLLDPQEVVGLAFLGRASLGVDALDLELRLILERRFGNLRLGANASATHTAQWAGRDGINWRFEESLAVGYTVGQVVAGLEARARTAAIGRHLMGTAFYVGPALTWSGTTLWVSATFQAQVAAAKEAADVGNGEPLTLRDDERYVGRVLVGFRL